MKNKLLFIPVILTTLSLVGCNQKVKTPEKIESKIDEPMEIAKYFRGRVRIDYPYDSLDIMNYRDIDATFSYEIRDKDNVILDGLNKVKSFERVDAINPTTEEHIDFYAYLDPEMVPFRYETHFTIYADGSLTYEVGWVSTGSERYNFTFDANVAQYIIDCAKEEIEDAKKAEEELISSFTVDNFVKVINRSKYYSSRRVVKQGNPYYVGDIENSTTVMSSILGLEYTPANISSREFGNAAIMVRTPNDYELASIKHVKIIRQSRLEFNEDGTYVELYFSVIDTYGRWLSVTKYFSIDPTKGKTAVEDMYKIFPNY